MERSCRKGALGTKEAPIYGGQYPKELLIGEKIPGKCGVVTPPNRLNKTICRAIECLCRAIMISQGLAEYNFHCIFQCRLSFLLRYGMRFRF